MKAFSEGDLPRAQDILLNLADHQSDSSGLYKEIGGLARGLHDSIRGFLSTLDPSLQEIVVNKIPDSGNRLEHMIGDDGEGGHNHPGSRGNHAGAAFERNGTDLGLARASRRIEAIGDSAGKKLDAGR